MPNDRIYVVTKSHGNFVKGQRVSLAEVEANEELSVTLDIYDTKNHSDICLTCLKGYKQPHRDECKSCEEAG